MIKTKWGQLDPYDDRRVKSNISLVFLKFGDCFLYI